MDATVLAGGVLTDNGVALYDTGATLAGTLNGSGTLVEQGPGLLTLSGATFGFSGELVLSGGAVALANGRFGGGVAFETTSAFATLDLGVAAAAGQRRDLCTRAQGLRCGGRAVGPDGASLRLRGRRRC